MSEHQVDQVRSYNAEQIRKIERGAVPDFESVADPDGWPYPDTNGLVEDPATPAVWDDGRGPGSADALDAKAFEIADDEVLCDECFLVHRPGRCDR